MFLSLVDKLQDGRGGENFKRAAHRKAFVCLILNVLTRAGIQRCHTDSAAHSRIDCRDAIRGIIWRGVEATANNAAQTRAATIDMQDGVRFGLASLRRTFLHTLHGFASCHRDHFLSSSSFALTADSISSSKARSFLSTSLAASRPCANWVPL